MDYSEQDVTDNMGLVFMMAKRMKHLTKGATIDFEDLISDGVLGLIHALDRFDPDKGFKFSPYACRCISGYMLRGHRTVNQETWKALQSKYEVPCNTISMYAPSFSGVDEIREVLGMDDASKSANRTMHNIHKRQVWEKLLPILTPNQRKVMELFISGKEQNEIAELLGVTRQAVQQAKKYAIRSAKSLFELEEKEAACL